MKEEFLTGLITLILVAAILIGGFWFLAHNKKENVSEKNMDEAKKEHQDARQPAVAGQFYPAGADELKKQVTDFLARADKEETAGAVLGLIVPHAGYEYSGRVAAYGFKQLEGENIDTVILIGNSHYAYFDGAAVYNQGYWRMPLGEVAIDEDLAQAIIKEDKRIKPDSGAHEGEHSLEVEIPFLQQVLPSAKIVPILLGNQDNTDGEVLAKAISKNIANKNVLVIASTDLSHYPPYEQANYADQKVCQAILTGQVEKLRAAISQLENEKITNAQTFMCGQEAVEVLMRVMADSGSQDIKLLEYANSGDPPVGGQGDKAQVVGYGAIAFYGPLRRIEASQRNNGELSKEEQQRLLAIARQTVESYVSSGQKPIFTENSAALNQKLGAFVTLKKHGQLRGCVGNFTPYQSELGTGQASFLPLWQNVVEMAMAAATQDHRFSPVAKNELKDLEYEVSVLSPLKKINDAKEIKLGQHGVEIKQGNRSGVFLPQVATETGWDLETFLGRLCSQKAGLAWDCWRSKEVEIYTFTAQVF